MKQFFTNLNLISSCGFILYDVENFQECTYATFFGVTTTMITACFSIFASESKYVFKVIDIAEELIEKSE